MEKRGDPRESLRSIGISHRSFCSRLRLFYNHIMFVRTTDNTQSTLEYVNGLNWIFLLKFFFFCFILPRRRRRRTIDLSVNALLTSIATIDGQFKSHVYSALLLLSFFHRTEQNLVDETCFVCSFPFVPTTIETIKITPQ